MMGVVVNGPWPMSQSISVQNEISGNMEKCYNGTSESSHSSVVAAVNSPWLKKMKLVKRIKRRIGLGSRGGESSPNNLPALIFHSVHGENVQLVCDGTIARRTNSFCNAITFSNRSVKINERINLKLLEASSEWKGVLRFGFTNVDPATMTSLPSYSIPNLTSKSGYWAKTFNESDTRFTGLNFKKDSILFYYVNQAGNVHIGINGDDKGVFFCGVDTRKPLWALIDVYGGTIALELVDTRTRLNNSRKSLNESAGNVSKTGSSSGGRPSSRSKQHPSNELELKILSSMGSMSLKSDEQYRCHQPPTSQQWIQQTQETPYHHPQHLNHNQPHCRQRSVSSCCQQHHLHHHQNFEDDDGDLFQKPQLQQQIEICSSKPKLLFQEADGGREDEQNQQKEQRKRDKLGEDESFGFNECHLEVVCRRASLSPASFNLFHNKSSTNSNCNSSTCNNNNRRNNNNNNNNNNATTHAELNSTISSPKIVSKSIPPSSTSNKVNNKSMNNMYIAAASSAPGCDSSLLITKTMAQTGKQAPTTNNTTTCSSSLSMTKMNPNRFSYHCGGNGINAGKVDNEYFEQKLLLAAATNSSPVSPASSSSTSSYVLVRGNEPIYTEVNNSNNVYSNNNNRNNNSCSSSNGYSYVESPVMQHHESSQIIPIYSTRFPCNNNQSNGTSTSSLMGNNNGHGQPQQCPCPSVEPFKQQQPTPTSTLPLSTSKKLLHQWSVGCVSCYERPVNSIFYACGHMCMCYECAFEYWTNKEGATCPICSTIISDVVIRNSGSNNNVTK